MKNSKARTAIFGMLVLVGLISVAGNLLSQAACTEYTGSFTEHFDNVTNIDLAQSPAKFWYNDPVAARDIVSINKLGANFQTANPDYIPAWINCCAAGDFDLDGWPDFVATASEMCNVLAIVKNRGVDGQIGTFTVSHWIDGSTGDAFGYPVTGVGGAPIDTSGSVSITAGDYDKDGDQDFLLITAATSTNRMIDRIWLYRNNLISGGINTGVLGFTRTDMTSAWSAAIGGIYWAGTSAKSIDIDKDGDIDIILGNYRGRVLKITNTNNGTVNSSTFVVAALPLISTGWGRFGVSTVAVADFDNDSDLDIICGSVSYDSLLYYKNDGTGNFTLFQSYSNLTKDLNDNLYDGAATVCVEADYDRDGYVDFIIGTDNWNYPNPAGTYTATGYGGKAFYFHNSGGTGFTQKLIFNGPTKTPDVYDFDLGITFDYNNDGVLDFLIADGNHSQKYYLFLNTIADVYNTSGQAVSVNITPTLSPDEYAITRVRFSALTQGLIGGSADGLQLAYYVSNNDGKSWELYATYTGAAIANVIDVPWHEFSSYGSRLRWKAVFTAAADAMPEYSNASFDTPYIDQIRIEYVYVEKREYSRTSDIAMTVKIGEGSKKVIVAATFTFPGLQGQLRAYDVTDMPGSTTSASTLQIVTQDEGGSSRYLAEGVTILWDAGAQLAARSASDRAIYATYRPTATTWARIDFTTANVATLAPLINDTNGDNAGLIDFIRGEGREWKLGDIQHSNPVFVPAPKGNPILMGDGYSAFATALANRTPVILAGANDGMLHCFNAATGAELWAYVPYNLLPKLKNLSHFDVATGQRVLYSDYFVDGSPVVSDVYFGGAWRTVVMCGQGKGAGSTIGGGTNYYFALDVTDVANPVPLWETTAATMGETWSTPAIGKISLASATNWVAFFGSGYDNSATAVVGNRFYTALLETGGIINTQTVANVNTSTAVCPVPYPDIQVAIPGSPTSVDTDVDGETESVYVGDLDGRMWKLDTSKNSTKLWTFTSLYTDRLFYPIMTKPVVVVDTLTGSDPMLYFGTGGDDGAPREGNYAFIALQDGTKAATVSWYLGDSATLGLPASKSKGTLGPGEKLWADPVISDNVVYFSTLVGSIENVNPCLNLGDVGYLYARYVKSAAGGLVGTTAFSPSTTERLQLTSKARRAVTAGEMRGTGSNAKRDIYIQEYDSSIQRLAQEAAALLKIKSWREVYRIIR